MWREGEVLSFDLVLSIATLMTALSLWFAILYLRRLIDRLDRATVANLEDVWKAIQELRSMTR